MNRRTALRTAGVAAVAGLSGCLDALREHYQGSFQGLIPIEIKSEAERHYDVVLEAYESGTDRQTYDESYTVTPDQRVSAPHLDAVEQSFRVTKFVDADGERTTRETTIRPETELVTVRITDDDLMLDIDRSDEVEGQPEPPSEPPDGPAGNGSNVSDGDPTNATETNGTTDGDSA
ncbi:hypothetical protein A6E15_08335 [Natrinema saccharevitans]|uniref:Uncharacterized protein n=1 Tax=Natrinema saccharevitans TaxID=301967 RepID=A0A1S8AWN1_9EURY|nr:hypothetical protein [Natrinema saccharevitans]OLZ40997.1 hypothetical protein A6E15_08335 [Natrinema saccharevitans]